MKVLILFGLILLNFTSDAQWTAMYGPLPYGNEFKGMSFVNDSTGYVTIHGGANDEQEFYISNAILKTTDYGLNWDTIYYHQWDCPCVLDSVYAIKDIYFLNNNDGWFTTLGTSIFAESQIFKTTDGGSFWTSYDTGVAGIHHIQLLNENHGIGSSPNNSGVETFDGGETWTIVPELRSYDFFLFDNCNNLVVDSGTLKRFSNCSWSTEEFPTLNDVPSRKGRSVHAWDETTFLLGTSNIVGFDNFGSIMRTTDGGASYSILDLYFSGGGGHIEFANDSVGFISVGSSNLENEAIYKTFDRGISWYGQVTPLNWLGRYASFGDIECLNENLCYAMNAKYIYKTTNGGGELGQMWTVVEEQNLDLWDLNVYPNPVGSILTLELKSNIQEDVMLDIFNSFGQLVKSESLQAGQSQTDIQVSFLPAGLYFISVTSKTTTKYLKFVKE